MHHANLDLSRSKESALVYTMLMFAPCTMPCIMLTCIYLAAKVVGLFSPCNVCTMHHANFDLLRSKESALVCTMLMFAPCVMLTSIYLAVLLKGGEMTAKFCSVLL